MLQYIAISNISIFLSGVLCCIAVVNIAIYRYIVILLHPYCTVQLLVMNTRPVVNTHITM